MDSPPTKRDLLRKLCEAVSLNPDLAHQLLQELPSFGYVPLESPDRTQRICETIQSRFSEVSGEDAAKLQELYQKIINSIATTSGVGSTVPSSSKSTADTASCSSHVPKQHVDNQSKPSTSKNMGIALQNNDRGDNQRTFLQEVMLAARGIKRDTSSWPRALQIIFSRLAHLGVLHNHLQEFINPSSGLVPEGVITLGLVTSIRDELTEYYRMLATWESQATDSRSTPRLVCVWAQEPLFRLKWLADITHAARHKKGGELASCVHFFLYHGDERVKKIARSLLTSITNPLLHMIIRWLSDGEVYDPFDEFFVETISGVPIDRMWHDRYRVRESMVPSFMSGVLVAQILAIGKSVAFIREASSDEATPNDHLLHLDNVLKSYKATDKSWWEAKVLREGVSAAHAAVSTQLLDVLITHHHLLDHLVAHRRYLLLAQGDFVDYFMTLVMEKLKEPANIWRVSNLMCSFDVALGTTSAEFEPQHVLDRLHLHVYPGEGDESGWEVFELQYRVDGPLGTLFPAACVASYRALFKQLWRFKCVEFALHNNWRDNASLQKRLKKMPEVGGLLRYVSCQRAAVLRLVGAIQAASSETAEAEWAELMAAVAARAHLDRLLALHQRALDRHSVFAMLHHTTEELRTYLENILCETLALRRLETALYAGINCEINRRDQFKQLKAERLSRGESLESEANAARDDMENRSIFMEFLEIKKDDVNVWARTYRDLVIKLILKLSVHPEESLNTLAFRLDYNDFYKRDNPKLQEPLTYQYKRLSEKGLTSAEGHTSAHDLTSAHGLTSAEAHTSAHGLTSAEAHTSAHGLTSAEAHTSAHGLTSAHDLTSAHGLTSPPEISDTSLEGHPASQEHARRSSD